MPKSELESYCKVDVACLASIRFSGVMAQGAMVGTLKVGSYLHEDTAKFLEQITGHDVVFIVSGDLSDVQQPARTEARLRCARPYRRRTCLYEQSLQ